MSTSKLKTCTTCPRGEAAAAGGCGLEACGTGRPAVGRERVRYEDFHDWVVVGISGVTCGGKTTLADKLANALTPVYVFNQDRYFYKDDSPHHVRVEGLELAHNNYDILSALDMAAMHADIIATLNGDDRSSARSLDRRKGQLHMKGKRFLVVEGFTILNYKPILNLCNLRYYLVLEHWACCQRRALRLYDPPDVAGYFDKCVWPAHLHYKAEIEKNPSIVQLDGTRPDAFERVVDDLRRLGCDIVTTV